jgi:hypothetical protein
LNHPPLKHFDSYGDRSADRESSESYCQTVDPLTGALKGA